MKKKVLILMLALLCLVTAIPFTISATEDTPATSVEVTVSIISGSPVVTAEKITVTDTNDDGLLTISDALYCAHEKKYKGGAAAGFSTEPSQYGLSLTKLWGDTSGAFGYYLNNVSPQSLLDNVQNGDSITAFIYQDTMYWSDAYSYFDRETVTVTEGESVTLTLSYLVTDSETWISTATPAEGATITVNGSDTLETVDRDGVVTINFSEPGTYVVSAHSDLNIVPPVCVVTVEEAPDLTPSEPSEPTETPQSYGWIIAICAAVICAAVAVAVAISYKNGKKQ